MEQPQEAKFMECTKCHTVHIVTNVNDERPTCKNCGNTEFIPRKKGIPGFMPEFCDQKKDKEIWDGVMAVVLSPINTWKSDIEKKYGITFSKNDISDLAHSITVVSKSMINLSRDEFSKDIFVKKLKNQYKSFLFSKKKYKSNKKKNE
jgi:hypothetical protein